MYKLQKANVSIVGPYQEYDWQIVTVEVNLAYGEDARYTPQEENFFFKATRSKWIDQDYYSNMLNYRPQWRFVGGTAEERELEDSLKALKAFNKYLKGLPVNIEMLPSLVKALFLHKKIKTADYIYYKDRQSVSTDHQKQAPLEHIFHVVTSHWQKLLDLPSREAA